MVARLGVQLVWCCPLGAMLAPWHKPQMREVAGLEERGMKHRHSVLVRTLGAFALVALATIASPVGHHPASAQETASLQPESFDSWLQSFRMQALAAGIRPETLDATLTGMTPNDTVVRLDSSQPDRKASYARYISRRLTAGRIARGADLAAQHAPTLQTIAGQFGVPPGVLVAIWGMETNYGSYLGDFDVLRSLATLAHDGRRRELFTSNLISALRLLDSGQVDRSDLYGSWAGAFGQTQFMPATFEAFGADGDGDGKKTIRSSLADAWASTANYLVKSGWNAGQGWGVPVRLPAGFDRSAVRNPERPAKCVRVLEKHSLGFPLSHWRALGLTLRNDGGWPQDDLVARLVEPDGPDGPAYLIFPNYDALLEYNCSNFYALSVGKLADAVWTDPATAMAGE